MVREHDPNSPDVETLPATCRRNGWDVRASSPAHPYVSANICEHSPFAHLLPVLGCSPDSLRVSVPEVLPENVRASQSGGLAAQGIRASSAGGRAAQDIASPWLANMRAAARPRSRLRGRLERYVRACPHVAVLNEFVGRSPAPNPQQGASGTLTARRLWTTAHRVRVERDRTRISACPDERLAHAGDWRCVSRKRDSLRCCHATASVSSKRP
jgi:hypothetical protein